NAANVEVGRAADCVRLDARVAIDYRVGTVGIGQASQIREGFPPIVREAEARQLLFVHRRGAGGEEPGAIVPRLNDVRSASSNGGFRLPVDLHTGWCHVLL